MPVQFEVTIEKDKMNALPKPPHDGDRQELSRAAVPVLPRTIPSDLLSAAITLTSVRSYLDLRFGPDPRHNDFSYDYTARALRHLGFERLEQVDRCIAIYADVEVSRVMTGRKQDQISRFELMLMAAMGLEFVTRYPLRTPLWAKRQKRILRQMKAAGLPVGGRAPPPKVNEADPE